MSNIAEVVSKTVEKYGKDATKMLDVIRDVQNDLGQLSDEAIVQIADNLNVSKVDVDGVISFYHFFSKKPVGKYAVYLNNSAVAQMMGRAAVAKAFEGEVGCSFGKTTDDGQIGLFDTSCIGMNDQEPAAIINDVIFTDLNEKKVKEIVADMKAGKDVQEMVKNYGDGKNQDDLVKAMVNNNIKEKGQVLLAPFESGSAIKKAVSMNQDDVINEVKTSNLRGRGGAGFPTGMKWGDSVKMQKAKNIMLFATLMRASPEHSRIVLFLLKFLKCSLKVWLLQALRLEQKKVSFTSEQNTCI